MAILFSFPKYETFAQALVRQTDFSLGEVQIDKFPDGESLVTLQTDVKNKEIVLVCGLEHANEKLASLLFFAKTARELGAKSVGIVAPYLGYMRQDGRFASGQAISAKIFAQFLSTLFDSLITLDPHTHRYPSLDDIFTIPTSTLHASPLLADWIKGHVTTPLLIGPDSESKQWVKGIADQIEAPCVVAQKTRHSATQVEIHLPDISIYKNHTPVLVDDIISTAHTMIGVTQKLKEQKMKPAVCLGIHAIFSGNAYEELSQAHVAKIVTTNAIAHKTNGIDVSPLFANALKKRIFQNK